MGSENDFEARVQKVTGILERQYGNIDKATATIEQNTYRANAFCGPVSQARSLIKHAQLSIESAENVIGFFTEIAKQPEGGDFYPNVAKAAIAQVAKRRLQEQGDVAVA